MEQQSASPNIHVENQPTPAAIMQIATGFWASKILLAAVKFDLFSLLSGNPMKAMQVKANFGWKCSDRHVYDFLDSLTAFGFLSREGLLENATYSNGRDTDFFLDKNKHSYIGGLLEMLNNRLYKFWGNLEEGFETGLPQNEAKDGINLFEQLYSSAERLQAFTNAMSGIQAGNFMAFASKFDFKDYKTLVDVGGSGGSLSIFTAQRQPSLQCITMDLPALEPIASANVARFNLNDRVKVHSGDFFKDEFPKADVVVMGNILHDWDEETKRMLIKKAYRALNDGGAFVAIENVIDDERRQNVFGLMMSLNMLIETGKGFDYTYADFKKWASDAGFSKTDLISLAGPSSAPVAYK